MLAVVTHEELRALLPRYAAGELEAEGALAVREHLADGCLGCLNDVFRRPVGLPLAPPFGAGPRRRPARWRRAAAVVLLVALIFGGAALVWSTVADLRRREAAVRADMAAAERRLAQRAADVAALGVRVGVLEREVTAAREALAKGVDAGVEITRLQERLDAAALRIAQLVRNVRRRDAELDRLRLSVEEREAVRELLTTPGVEMLDLTAVPPFRRARGHVVWHPGQTNLVLYAFDLPPAPHGGTYRVRLGTDGTAAPDGFAFRPGARGEVALPLRLGAPGASLREVVVVREPGGQPVLAGRRAPDGDGR
jgi:hypothetical protein